MEQLKVGTNDLPLVAKKNVDAAVMSVSSVETFPTAGHAFQLEVPTAVAANIRSRKVGELC
jgi:pimeloyl-ACP methyl ester carboxylesterase